jgi:hypothetical protein
MVKGMKIAVSLPDDLVASADRAARRRRTSVGTARATARSRTYSRARRKNTWIATGDSNMRHLTTTFMAHRGLASALAIVASAVIIARAAELEAQSLTVAPSGRATTEVVLTPEGKPEAKPLVVRIDYGQPHLRGRQLHTETLVPYDQPWLLVANASTKLSSDVDLVIGGARVARGTYVLRALPSRKVWKLLIEKDTGQSPDTAPGEKPPEVVATVDLKQTTLPAPLESFTMWLIPSTAAGPPRGELRFAWGTTLLSTEWATK